MKNIPRDGVIFVSYSCSFFKFVLFMLSASFNRIPIVPEYKDFQSVDALFCFSDL